MYARTEHTSALKLFQQMGRSIRTGTSPEHVLQSAVDALGWQFSLDRAVALLADEGSHELKIKAEYRRDQVPAVGKRQYQLLPGSEMYRLLSQGRPVPLMEIQGDASLASTQPELNQFIKDTGSKSVVAFPLLQQGTLIGCLTVHHCQEDRSFS